jgi:hypothetical protein
MAISNNSIDYFYTLFDKKHKPLIVGIRTADRNIITPLYIPGRSIYDITQSIKKHVQWFERSLLNGRTIVTNDFKSILNGFKFELHKEKLSVFDIFDPLPKISNTFEELSNIVNSKLLEMQKCTLYKWQNIIANASIVYESLERQGILVGGLHQYPKWSQHTFTGRSKNIGFNLQGTSADDDISDPSGNQFDLFVNFDWRAADIRIAAILSGDKILSQMSIESDPYMKLSEILDLPRSECKTMLLRAINAIDIDNPIFQIFPTMKEWMILNKSKLDNGEAVSSILGRKFFNAEKPRSAFNATMQGSIAQAMQLTIRKVWELDFRLLVETHDSITIACNKNSLKYVIQTITNIMCRPFFGILNSNPVFPVRVNIGKRWCQWKPFRLYYDVDRFQSI